MDVETCELAAKFLDKQVTTVNVNEMVPDNRPAGCTYHQDENLQLWTESRGGCTFGDGCLCEVTENLIGDKCIKHADRGPLEMEIGSCCGRPGKISCGPGYVLQAPFPDVCGGSCPESWCNHHGVLAETRSFSCVPEEPTGRDPRCDTLPCNGCIGRLGRCNSNSKEQCENAFHLGAVWCGQQSPTIITAGRDPRCDTLPCNGCIGRLGRCNSKSEKQCENAFHLGAVWCGQQSRTIITAGRDP